MRKVIETFKDWKSGRYSRNIKKSDRFLENPVIFKTSFREHSKYERYLENTIYLWLKIGQVLQEHKKSDRFLENTVIFKTAVREQGTN